MIYRNCFVLFRRTHFFKYYLYQALLVLCLFAAAPALAQTQIQLKNDSGIPLPDTLLFKLQKAQAAVTEINAANKKGYDSGQIAIDLKDIRKSIAPIKTDLSLSKKVVDTRTLQGYQLILKNSQERLTAWRNTLSKTSNDLQRMSKEVVDLSSDSVLAVTNGDTTQKKLYTRQLVDTKLRLQNAGKSVTASLDTVSRLLADVSAAYLDVADLQANIIERLKTSGKIAIGQESPFIWKAPRQEAEGSSVAELLSASYEGQNKILGYFLKSTWDNRTLLLLFGIAFFLWVYLNFLKAKKPENQQLLGELDFKYISPVPVLATLIVMLNLTPLFEPDAPALYIELIEFALLVLLTISFWKQLPPKDMRYWLFIVLLYVVTVLTNAAVHSAIYMRLWLIALNVGSLYVGVQFYRKLKEVNISQKFVRPVLMIYLFFNFLSILSNVLGRISLAKVYSVTAIIGLTQIIGLAIFIQIFTDALELQIKISSCNGGLFSRLNISHTRASFKKALSVVAVILWVLVFLINLSIAGGVFAFIQQILAKPRTFGSVTFTLNNVLFFGVIVYISNVLQKNVGVLFGEKTVDFSSSEVEHKSSKLTLIRLVIAIIGILLAVTASGIPLDKLTVVLGALSVGIGLGMQNIVNNFVSGIILIFEKPFQIGDYVELADKKGKIQDIGIRSSRMLTQQGSEVIIPNGDLLSNRLVNWTLNSAYVKSELLFKVNISTDIDAVTKIIEEEIDKMDDTVKNTPPEVLINSVAADAMELRVLVWINNIYVESAFKSRLFRQLIARFGEAQIKVM
jgi:potassium efflux system protein